MQPKANLDDSPEYTLLQKRNILLYKIPPVLTAKGHYLNEWKEAVWQGNLRVAAKGDRAFVYFLDDAQQIYAVCPVADNIESSIQKCVDSSRGYAVRIEDPASKRYMWVGLAFRDRNDSFDFNVCFEDFKKHKDMDKNPAKYAEANRPVNDFTLKSGEKLSLNIGGLESTGSRPKPAGAADLSAFKFAPPPGSRSGPAPAPAPAPAPTFEQPRPPTQTFTSAQQSSDFGWGFDWGAPTTQTTQPTQQLQNVSTAQTQTNKPSNNINSVNLLDL
eukprot:TRINITY_DN495_c0_g1_i7.p1 TRINITY_DN495_c0_g1~~TRINITY_DN495_c0_g1_i7.p1  ORF type:complete len:273 (-),score=62.85 TRINITY_DN495_c0_g1_i7:110-928(-)